MVKPRVPNRVVVMTVVGTTGPLTPVWWTCRVTTVTAVGRFDGTPAYRVNLGDCGGSVMGPRVPVIVGWVVMVVVPGS